MAANPERREVIRGLYTDGWSIRRIAKHVGIARATVYRYLIRLDLPRRRPGRAPSASTLRAMELLRRGVSVPDIASLTGRSRRSIRYVRHKMGIPAVHDYLTKEKELRLFYRKMTERCGIPRDVARAEVERLAAAS